MSRKVHVVQDKTVYILAGQEPSISLSNPSQVWIWDNVYMWLNYNIVGPQSKSSASQIASFAIMPKKEIV